MKQKLLLLLTFTSIVPLGGLSRADEFDVIRRRIRNVIKQRQVPSLAVGVAREGKIIWEEGFGWADRENQRRANEHTMYSLASISKPITATGIMVLVHQQKISLDRRANAYLKDAQLTAHLGKVEDATVRKLANHTSGLPLHYQFFYEDEPHRRPPMAESIRRYGHLVTPPGEHYQYANFGYGILDHIIALKSQQTYAAFMRQHVFLPLGMKHSSVYIDDALKQFAAVRYAPDQSPLPLYEFDHPGASAVYSSAHDLLRFGMLHVDSLLDDQKAILEPKHVKEMQKPTAPISANSGYGVGWRITKDDLGYRTVTHTGGMPGVSTRLTLVPDEKLVVTALCNKSDRLPHDIVPAILDILLPDRVKRRRERKSAQSAPTKQVKLPSGVYQGKIHTYAGDQSIKMWVHKDSRRWTQIQIGNQFRTLLNNRSFKNGILEGRFVSDIGTADAAKRPYFLQLKLFLRNGRLTGSVAARSNGHPQKGGNTVSYWCEMDHVSQLSEPVTLFDGKSLDSWETLKKNDFAKHGEIKLVEKSIEIGRGKPGSGVRYKGTFPRSNYEVSFEARRLEGTDFFCGVTFPVGKSYCTLICGGWGGSMTGLSNIDNMSAAENDSSYYIEYANGRWYPVRIQVTDDAIKAWIDRKPVIEIKRQNRKFSIWWEQEPARPFGFATWNTKGAIRNVVLGPP